MVAPWAETPTKVVVEFKKSTGLSRKIQLTHSAQYMPQQLAGRLAPEAWAAFMADVESQLVPSHPYTARPNSGYCLNNCMGFLSMLTLGIGCFQPDAGNYQHWLRQVHHVIDRHKQYFSQCGLHMGTDSVHGSYWIYINVAQSQEPGLAYGQPVYSAQPPQGLQPMIVM